MSDYSTQFRFDIEQALEMPASLPVPVVLYLQSFKGSEFFNIIIYNMFVCK